MIQVQNPSLQDEFPKQSPCHRDDGLNSNYTFELVFVRCNRIERWAGAGTIRLSVSGTPSGEQGVASQFLT